MKEQTPVKIQEKSRRTERKRARVCVSCGLSICPGANDRKCSAQRFTEAEIYCD